MSVLDTTKGKGIFLAIPLSNPEIGVMTGGLRASAIPNPASGDGPHPSELMTVVPFIAGPRSMSTTRKPRSWTAADVVPCTASLKLVTRSSTPPN